MTRTKEYFGFAIRFCGLGYIVLWPLSSADAGGHLFGAAYVCGGRAFAILDLLCNAPHPLQLSLPLHAIGAISALVVIFQLSMRAIRRRRRAHTVGDLGATALAGRIPLLRTGRQKTQRPARPVKPRAQFGLRVPQ